MRGVPGLWREATVVAGKFVAARCLLLLKASVDVRDEAGRSLVALAALHGQHAWVLGHLADQVTEALLAGLLSPQKADPGAPVLLEA